MHLEASVLLAMELADFKGEEKAWAPFLTASFCHLCFLLLDVGSQLLQSRPILWTF